jgi:hypothetical protein
VDTAAHSTGIPQTSCFGLIRTPYGVRDALGSYPNHFRQILELWRLALWRPCYPALPWSISRLRESQLSIGAGEGIRTLDPDLGKVVLYP